MLYKHEKGEDAEEIMNIGFGHLSADHAVSKRNKMMELLLARYGIPNRGPQTSETLE